MANVTQTDLVNAKIQAVGMSDVAAKITKARAYYENDQYPDYGPVAGWPEVAGELKYPKIIVPLPSIIVDKSATFLMKTEPRFYVKDNETASAFIRKVIDDNSLDYFACAKRAGVEGGVWFKFYFDGIDKRRPWKIMVLSPAEVVPVYDPHDITDLWMVRVQYGFEKADGSEWYYREEWTDQTYTVYQELPAGIVEEREALEAAREGDLTQENATGPWHVKERLPNVFGVIPFQFVRNKTDPLTPNGEGDYWTLYDMFDRINVAYDCSDKGLQFSSGPVAVFIETDNAPTSLMPHSTISITGPNADAKLLDMRFDMRTALEYVGKLESFTYSSSGIVNPKLEDVAGLGQLSYAALQLLHGPLIELTQKKRANWADRGLCLFFEKMLRAGERWAGSGLRGTETMEVSAAWGEYFPLGGVDKQIELTNIKLAMELGLPFDDGAAALARIMGIAEEELAAFLKKAAADMETRQQLQEAVALMKQTAPQQQPGAPAQPTGGGQKGAARKQASGANA